MNQTKNIPRLMNLAYWGFNKALKNDDGTPREWTPRFNPDGSVAETFCNFFINYVCTGFGYVDLAGKTANEIFDFLSDFKNGWITQNEASAQFRANEGVLVIAAWKNPAGHGHVNLIVPGLLEMSGSFGIQVPKCTNVGKDVFFGKKISYAFTPAEAPTYFAMAGMIS